MRRRFGGWLRSGAIIFTNTIILVVVVVLGAEWWARGKVPARAAATEEIWFGNQQAAYHPWAGYRNSPGFTYAIGDWVSTKINRFGWRGPEPTMAKPKAVRRALLLGDSVAFSGFGCREGVTLHAALKEALELRTGEEWEVINMAVGGGFASVSLGTLTHEGIHFNPDFVVTLNGHNDLLVLDKKIPFLRLGVGHFPNVLYHSTQATMHGLFDPRTGKISDEFALDQLLSKSALFTWLKSKTNANFKRQVLKVDMGTGFEVTGFDRMDNYVNTQLSISYVSAGAGAKFIGFLQPYLSLKHKVIGPADREAIKTMERTAGPHILPWLDEIYPQLRDRLQRVSLEHPQYKFVDLTLMFTDEQVFADAVHMDCPDNRNMLGNQLLAARMADEMVKEFYPQHPRPNWRQLLVHGAPSDWQEQSYLRANPDVADLVAAGKYANGFDHYRQVGITELRPGGFVEWDEASYLAANADVAAAVKAGTYATGYDHYLAVGRMEGRRKGLPAVWNEESYLAFHPDVAAAVTNGQFASGQDHYRKAGLREGRRGGFSGWDEEGYLLEYPDVRAAVTSKKIATGALHWLSSGRAEGRRAILGNHLRPF